MHGGNLRAAAKKYGIDAAQIIDFSANINPLGVSPAALMAIKDNLGSIEHYPDPDCTELRQAFAENVGLPKENLVMGNGAVELVFILMHLIKPKQVLIPVPTFSEYKIAVTAAGGTVKSLPLDREENFVFDLEKIITQLNDVDAVFICNPNNPTGTLIKRQDLEVLLAHANKTGKWVIVDEAFMDFIRCRDQYSVKDLVNCYERLFVSYSLTKFHALPGLRLGAGIANSSLITKLEQSKDPWNVNALAQAAGTASLRDTQYIRDTIDTVEKEKEYLYKALTEIPGLKTYQPAVNYIFIDISATGLTSTELSEQTGRRGILIRDCSSYETLGPVFIRVAVKSRPDNVKLLDVMQDILKK